MHMHMAALSGLVGVREESMALMREISASARAASMLMGSRCVQSYTAVSKGDVRVWRSS